jgi:hypothetical protein
MVCADGTSICSAPSSQEACSFKPLTDSSTSVRLIYVEAARGLRSLQRGWRTPDPSPMPGLSKCAAAYPCLALENLTDSSTAQGYSDEHSWAMSSSRRELSVSTISDRDPPHAVFGESGSNVSLHTAIRTPSPSPDRLYGQSCVSFNQALCLPCEAAPKVSSNAKDLRQAAAKQMVPFQVSAGTLGHPYSCADACKFVGKTRGCKDGAECDHCHLCKWYSPTAVRNYGLGGAKDRRLGKKASTASPLKKGHADTSSRCLQRDTFTGKIEGGSCQEASRRGMH